MTSFWRLFLSVIIALSFICLTPSAHSSPILITQITAGDLLELGVDKMRGGNYQQAIENFNQAIELKKDFAVAYSDRALADLQLQDYHQAMSDDKPLRVYADCTQAINFAPDNFEAYLNRGVALYRQGDIQLPLLIIIERRRSPS